MMSGRGKQRSGDKEQEHHATVLRVPAAGVRCAARRRGCEWVSALVPSRQHPRCVDTKLPVVAARGEGEQSGISPMRGGRTVHARSECCLPAFFRSILHSERECATGCGDQPIQSYGSKRPVSQAGFARRHRKLASPNRDIRRSVATSQHWSLHSAERALRTRLTCRCRKGAYPHAARTSGGNAAKVRGVVR